MADNRISYDDVTNSYIPYLESEAEWAPGTEQLVNTTVTARPGALTFDYTLTHEVGPQSQEENDEGFRSWDWKLRRDGLDFYLARETDERDDWQDEEFLFTADDNGDIGTISLTFDQNARPFVSYEQNGMVFIWWYDPNLPGVTIRSVTSGRTPVCLLDDKREEYLGSSDILLFYINDSNELAYRRQRDRYNDEFLTGTTVDDNSWLEVVYRSIDNRVIAWGVTRDPSDDSYTAFQAVSNLYPFTFNDEFSVSGGSVQSFNIERILITLDEGPDQFEISGGSVQSIDLYSIIRERSIDDPDQFEISGGSVQDFGMTFHGVIVHTYTVDPPDRFEVSGGSVQSFDIVQIVLNHNIDDPDRFEISGGSVQSFSLTTP